jgi:hypothetical protein
MALSVKLVTEATVTEEEIEVQITVMERVESNFTDYICR